jgi:hypothetical protein
MYKRRLKSESLQFAQLLLHRAYGLACHVYVTLEVLAPLPQALAVHRHGASNRGDLRILDLHPLLLELKGLKLLLELTYPIFLI